MSIIRVACPGCGAGLRSPNPAGFNPAVVLTCPKCETKFAAGDAVASAPAPKPARPRVVDDEDDAPRKKARPAVADDDEDDRPKKKKRRDDDEDDDRPKKKKKKKKKPAGMPPAVYWAIRGVVLLLLLGGLAFAVKLYLDNKAEAERINEVNKKIDADNAKTEDQNNRGGYDGGGPKPSKKGTGKSK